MKQSSFLHVMKLGLWGAGVMLSGVAIADISRYIIEEIVYQIIPTPTATIDDYHFWLAAGFVLGFALFIVLCCAYGLSSLALKWVTAGLYLLVIGGVLTLLHEAWIFAARATAGIPIDHLYWLAFSLGIAFVAGNVFALLILISYPSFSKEKAEANKSLSV